MGAGFWKRVANGVMMAYGPKSNPLQWVGEDVSCASPKGTVP